jgi:hypothetical protein
MPFSYKTEFFPELDKDFSSTVRSNESMQHGVINLLFLYLLEK